MKLGIIGLSGCGKSTVFEALTHDAADSGRKGDNRIATVQVPDERIDILSRMYNPKKTVYARVEYFLPGRAGTEGGKEKSVWAAARNCDALIHVVRHFRAYGLEPPTPAEDIRNLDQELILTDLVGVEKRLERLELEQKRHRPFDAEEMALLQACRQQLENETPLRLDSQLATAPQLRGFAFLSAKPLLVLFNNEDDDDRVPTLEGGTDPDSCLMIRGKLEQELAQMTPAEAQEFLEEFNITASAMDRVISKSYEIMGLTSFFTVGEDEVRSWPIRRDTAALDAAEVVHSDIKQGFIRAEVLAYDHLMAAGSYPEARKRGTVRLEGKTYPVQDADIINFRFNV